MGNLIHKRGAFMTFEQFQMEGSNISGVYTFLESQAGKAAISVILGKLNTLAPPKMEESALINAHNAGVRFAIDALYALSEPPVQTKEPASSIEDRVQQDLEERLRQIQPK